MKSPLTWYGGKFYMLKQILSFVEAIAHHTYVEAFGGAGHLIFAKKPSPVDVYNDLHEGLYNFMAVLRDKPNELQLALTLTPYSRQEFENAKNWATITNPVEKARQFFVTTQQGFSAKGDGTSWGYAKNTSRNGMSKRVSQWLTQIDARCPQVVDRIRSLQIENLDFADLIDRYDAPETLFYLDPPYLPRTRIAKKVYLHEMAYEDHVRLVKTLANLKGKAVLSGYDNELYDELGWHKTSIGDYNLVASTQKEKRKKTEFLWIKD